MKTKAPPKIMLRLVENYLDKRGAVNILSVGCGTQGAEAIGFAKALPGAKVAGIDINLQLKQTMAVPKNCVLIKADFARAKQKPDSYDLVSCFHVIEHVKDPEFILKKISDVLKKDAVAFIGFPNKNRIAGYINPSERQNFLEKIKFNIIDYGKKITGKFNNKNAHAGFCQREFKGQAKKYFKIILPATDDYYRLKYPRFGKLIGLISVLGLDKYFYPSNYFILKK